ncbi:CPBP family intramembrane metalloprotease [Salipaludibacillus agaradhaerens]|uniref:CPBP family intramembrane metalloprotease n=1 Tax=Salipaludibacillus agaradhaerens TaxID=76935 RepID=A0A9Q4G0D4_SALAG|nr:type II CAAX endopeptidase family protein [Salipaludibacillus agaradhaerens]MCR6097773.1 CPBP family intramembrane metalloprotease [Salipaludibacillus agaradhaerens]MCR6116598.1 CPBP family intramembrane metalloprotease [Salipaludibacillus agaradhaerens]
MKKNYWLIIIVFILTQLSPVVFIPLLALAGFRGTELYGMTLFVCFTIGFIIIALLARKTEPQREFMENRATASETVVWSIIGIFMAFAGQTIAALIETNLFGVEVGSENTQVIVDIANAVPLMIIVVAVFVPIMEELVFRKVIFGSLYPRFGFWISALASGLIFAVVHMEFEHLLVYASMGVVFAYLYWKTKRIIVPILAHVGVNSFVMIVQVIFGDEMQEIIEQHAAIVQTVQAIMRGFLL